MKIASKASTLLLLASVIVIPLSGCSGNIGPMPTTETQAVAIKPNDGRLNDNTDLYKGANNTSENNISETVSGFYKRVSSSESFSLLDSNNPNNSVTLTETYKDAVSYAHKGASSNADMYLVFTKLTNSLNSVPSKESYSLVLNPSNIKVKGATAVVDTIGATENIAGKPSLITSDRANTIHMIEVSGEWYIDITATKASWVK